MSPAAVPFHSLQATLPPYLPTYLPTGSSNHERFAFTLHSSVFSITAATYSGKLLSSPNYISRRALDFLKSNRHHAHRKGTTNKPHRTGIGHAQHQGLSPWGVLRDPITISLRITSAHILPHSTASRSRSYSQSSVPRALPHFSYLTPSRRTPPAIAATSAYLLTCRVNAHHQLHR